MMMSCCTSSNLSSIDKASSLSAGDLQPRCAGAVVFLMPKPVDVVAVPDCWTRSIPAARAPSRSAAGASAPGRTRTPAPGRRRGADAVTSCVSSLLRRGEERRQVNSRRPTPCAGRLLQDRARRQPLQIRVSSAARASAASSGWFIRPTAARARRLELPQGRISRAYLGPPVDRGLRISSRTTDSVILPGGNPVGELSRAARPGCAPPPPASLQEDTAVHRRAAGRGRRPTVEQVRRDTASTAGAGRHTAGPCGSGLNVSGRRPGQHGHVHLKPSETSRSHERAAAVWRRRRGRS